MLQIVLQPTGSSIDTTPSSGVSAGSAVAIVGFVLVLLVGALVVAGALRKGKAPDMNGLAPQKVKHLWDQIEQTAKQGKTGGKIAIIEADKLLDTVFKAMNVPGETMGERLKAAGYRRPALRNVWTAHRVRNRLVHETDYELRDRDVRETLEDFKRALQELKVL